MSVWPGDLNLAQLPEERAKIDQVLSRHGVELQVMSFCKYRLVPTGCRKMSPDAVLQDLAEIGFRITDRRIGNGSIVGGFEFCSRTDFGQFDVA